MTTLGGTMFVHNAVEYDYCVAEALRSLCAACDNVVIVDASSTDGTVELLNAAATELGNLRVVTGAMWACAPDHRRLAMLSDFSASHLRTDWIFMLQADEVIHEDSIPAIREAIESTSDDSFMVRRYNLFGDLNHYLRFDLPQIDKPCNDQIVRLARTGNPAHGDAAGDAESLRCDPHRLSFDFLDRIRIIHYGMVRRDAALIEKMITMQKWFFGHADPKIVGMVDQGRWDWELLKQRHMLTRLEFEHPKFSREWAEERQRVKKELRDHKAIFLPAHLEDDEDRKTLEAEVSAAGKAVIR